MDNKENNVVPLATRFPELDGLRGLAALAVCACHIQMTFWVTAFSDTASALGQHAARFLRATLDGEFCVWLFWILSAFALSIKFHSSPGLSARHLQESAIKRLPRLWVPVAFTSCISFLTLYTNLQDNQALARLLNAPQDSWIWYWNNFTPTVGHFLYFLLFSAFFDYDAPQSYNNVLWTMQIELYGSLFLFATLFFIGKLPNRVFFYAILTILFTLQGEHWLTSFILGSALCDYHFNIHRMIDPQNRILRSIQNSKLLSLSGVVFLLYVAGAPNYFNVANLILSLATLVLCIYSKPVSVILKNPFFTFLGKISFGVYLIHVPLIFILGTPVLSLLLTFLPATASTIITSAILLMSSLICGYAVWYFVDRPAINLANKTANYFLK